MARSVQICRVLLLLALCTRTAAAQPLGTAPEDGREQARALADRGYEHFQAGRYAEALTAFREAERLYHAPTLLLMAARAYERLGRLLEAQTAYRSLTTASLPPDAPDAFREAQQAAQTELAALQARIPMVQVLVAGPSPGGAQVSLDGTPIQAGGPPTAHDPGDVTVIARTASGPLLRQIVTLQEGRTERITLHLGPAAAQPAAARGYLLPAGIAFGLAGASLAAGAVTAVIARNKLDDVISRCTPDDHCLVSDQPLADEATRLSTASIITFAAGGLSAAAGVTLLILRPGSAPQGATQTRAGLALGPGSVSVTGSF